MGRIKKCLPMFENFNTHIHLICLFWYRETWTALYSEHTTVVGCWGGGERTMFFVYTSSKAVLAKVFECESQISILVDKFSQSHLLVKMYNWHYGKMHFSSSLDCIANCASIYRHLYITALLYLGGESTFKFYWKLNFIISALIMHVLKKCTQIGENVLSQHKFGGAVQFCFDPFQGWGGC